MSSSKTGYVSQFLVVSLFASSVAASQYTIGPNGINSVSLGLNGSGVVIGALDVLRPGQPTYDNAANCCNSHVVPLDVYVQDHHASVDESVATTDSHPLAVAGVMISTDTTTLGGPSGTPPTGVSPSAFLYASAFNTPSSTIQSARSTAAVAQSNRLHYLVTLLRSFRSNAFHDPGRNTYVNLPRVLRLD
jgi:hypothetical protein